MTAVPSSRVACVEVGGGGVQTVLLGGDADAEVLDGAHRPNGLPLLMAVPGYVVGDRVLAASNLDWFDVDPAAQLGLAGPVDLLCNDAEAAALGEAALRGVRGLAGLVYVGLGTGVGGAVVADGAVVAANLFGHGGSCGEAACACGRRGCLETVAAGWALPDPLPADRYAGVASAVAAAVQAEPLAAPELVVIGGGVARRHPGIVDLVADALPGRVVEPSAAPERAKSATAWGLLHAFAAARAAA